MVSPALGTPPKHCSLHMVHIVGRGQAAGDSHISRTSQNWPKDLDLLAAFSQRMNTPPMRCRGPSAQDLSHLCSTLLIPLSHRTPSKAFSIINMVCCLFSLCSHFQKDSGLFLSLPLLEAGDRESHASCTTSFLTWILPFIHPYLTFSRGLQRAIRTEMQNEPLDMTWPISPTLYHPPPSQLLWCEN